MKLKEINVKEYNFWDKFKCYKIENVNLLVESDSKVTRENFNQEKDFFYISSNEIDRISKLVVDQNIKPFQEYHGRTYPRPVPDVYFK